MPTNLAEPTTAAKVDTKQLVTTYLRYGGTAKPFKTFAYAQLAAKALYISDQPLKVAEVAGGVARLIGVTNVSHDLINQGLSYLKEVKEASDQHENWRLNNAGISKCRDSLESAERQRARVLSGHYPRLRDDERLAPWFAEATAAFFGHHGDDWVASVSRKSVVSSPRYKTLEQILQLSIKTYNLADHRQELIDGFLTFLQSDNTTDQQYFMYLAHAMFAARLVAVDVGADPITLNEIRGAKLVLDTNVLFALALGNRRIGKALEAFGAALRSINAKPVILHSTREEYLGVLANRRNELLRLVDRYPAEIIEKTRDDFLDEARLRGCKVRSDYERFFTSLTSLLDLIEHGPTIVMEDDEEIESTLQEATKDERFKQKIQEYCLKYRRYRPEWRQEKSDRALGHDASILKTVELLRKRGERCWVLSLDKSLQILSLHQTNPRGFPDVMSLDALIEILALNGAGPESDANNFAPLLANTIINNCVPREDTYTTEDLHWLSSINEHAAEMPTDKVDSLLRDVSRARIAGKSIDDTNLQAQVNRAYQKELLSRDAAVEAAHAKSAEARREAETERQKRQSRETELVNIKVINVHQRARNIFALQIFAGVVISGLIGYVAYRLSRYITEQNVIDYMALIVGFAVPLGGIFWKSFVSYRSTTRNADKSVREELRLKTPAE